MDNEIKNNSHSDKNNKNYFNIAIVQYNAKVLEINYNKIKVEELINNELKNSVIKQLDLILFPEMTLTGYVFNSKKEIFDYCEEAVTIVNNEKQYKQDFNSNMSLSFGSLLAKRHNCNVLIGYPEKFEKIKLNKIDNRNDYIENNNNNENKYDLYNSIALFSKEGVLINNFRKHFLYQTDKVWASEGEKFDTVEISNSKNTFKLKTAIGICMDINPYEFKAPFDDYEFGNFCVKENVDLICFSANWILNESTKDEIKRVYEVINYWVTRLTPILESNSKKSIYLCTANRVGEERGTSFTGSSSITQLTEDIRLLNYLKIFEEKVIIQSLSFNDNNINVNLHK